MFPLLFISLMPHLHMWHKKNASWFFISRFNWLGEMLGFFIPPNDYRACLGNLLMGQSFIYSTLIWVLERVKLICLSSLELIFQYNPINRLFSHSLDSFFQFLNTLITNYAFLLSWFLHTISLSLFSFFSNIFIIFTSVNSSNIIATHIH